MVTREVLNLFHGLRRVGNDAVHAHANDRSEALHQLRMARQLAVWFHRAFGTSNQPLGPFVPPPDPAAATAALTAELDRLRADAAEQRQQAERLKLRASEVSALRERAEADAARAYADLQAAMELAEQSEARRAADLAEFEQRLTAVRAASADRPSPEVQAVFERIRAASAAVDLDEAATRSA